MNEPLHDPLDPTAEGQRRAAAQRAHLEASREASTAASLEAHRAISARLRVSHEGLFPNMSPTDLGAAVAARRATVGSDYGGRPLERRGGTFDHANDGPAPSRVDLTRVNMPPGYQVGERPIVRWARERNG